MVFFHTNIPGFSGGYVGVDIFYVISGYLITSLVARDIAQGKFSLISFYDRRIRRIFPALFGVVFFCVVAAAAMLTPSDFLAFGKTMLAMTGFASNIYFRYANGGWQGYFGHLSQTQVLLHTWSLSVEEQFYVFFPLTLLLLTRWARNRAAKVLSIVALASFALSLWAVHQSPVGAFYLLIPRAWELLIGSLLALKIVPFAPGRVGREAATLLGLGLIAYAVCFFTDETTFPGAAALLPCVGAALIIYAGESGPSFLKSALSFQPLVFVGVLSYSLYLWHWPLIIFTRYFFAVGKLSGLETVSVILASLIMAFVSFEFIEKPFRGRESSFTRRQIFSLGLTATVISAGLSTAIILRHGFPRRFSESTKQLIYQNEARKNDFEDVCENWKLPVREFSQVNSCTTDANAPHKMLFWGDSHVQQIIPVVRKLHDAGELNGHGLVFAISAGCLPAEHLNHTEKGFYCDTFSTVAMSRARQQDIDTVYMGFSLEQPLQEGSLCPSVEGRCVGRISKQEALRRFLEELSHRIGELKMLGKRVIVSVPYPIYDKSIPDLEIHNAMFGRFGFSEVASDTVPRAMREQVAGVARNAGAELFDPRLSLCNPLGCLTQVNGVSIYIDTDHLATTQVGILTDNLKQVLQR